MKAQNPFSGRPRTIEMVDESGTPVYIVKVHELTPERAKFRDRLLYFSKIALAILYVYLIFASNSPTTWPQLFGTLIFCCAFYLTIVFLAWLLLPKGTRIVITKEYVSHRRFLRWKHYDRIEVNDFAAVPDDRAREEQIHIAYAEKKDQKRNKIIKRNIYYGKSFNIVFMHGGQRVPLLTVYGEAATHRIVSRLQLCFRNVNDWRPSTGDAETFDDLNGARQS